MKIIRHPKILPCECEICHTVFQPEWRKLYLSSRYAKENVRCPMCKARNYVKFEEGAENETREVF